MTCASLSLCLFLFRLEDLSGAAQKASQENTFNTHSTVKVQTAKQIERHCGAGIHYEPAANVVDANFLLLLYDSVAVRVSYDVRFEEEWAEVSSVRCSLRWFGGRLSVR